MLVDDVITLGIEVIKSYRVEREYCKEPRTVEIVVFGKVKTPDA